MWHVQWALVAWGTWPMSTLCWCWQRTFNGRCRTSAPASFIKTTTSIQGPKRHSTVLYSQSAMLTHSIVWPRSRETYCCCLWPECLSNNHQIRLILLQADLELWHKVIILCLVEVLDVVICHPCIMLCRWVAGDGGTPWLPPPPSTPTSLINTLLIKASSHTQYTKKYSGLKIEWRHLVIEYSINEILLSTM